MIVPFSTLYKEDCNALAEEGEQLVSFVGNEAKDLRYGSWSRLALKTSSSIWVAQQTVKCNTTASHEGELLTTCVPLSLSYD